MGDIHLVEIFQALDQLPSDPAHLHLPQRAVLLLVREEVAACHELEDHVGTLGIFLLEQVDDSVDVGVVHAFQEVDLVLVADRVVIVLEFDCLASYLEPGGGAV